WLCNNRGETRTIFRSAQSFKVFDSVKKLLCRSNQTSSSYTLFKLKEMENGGANQLPEVDALPDGFVESSAEPQAPSTPSIEHEKPVSDCKERTVSLHDRSSEKILSFDSQTSEDTTTTTDKTEKLRTFPVPLSDSESTASIYDNAHVVSEAPSGVFGSGEVNDHVQRNCQTSERQIEGGSVIQAPDAVDSLSESIELQKGRKPETSETKRKNAKRSLKAEKEFLEFTLKYQQVLSERDAGQFPLSETFGAFAVRDKLESLCRELQRQNKMLMEECKRVSTEGQNLRLDLSTKFQDAIKDVSIKLEEQKEESLAQLKENEMLRIKLKELADQYALSEQQHAQKLKQKTLELQIADLKIKQHEEKLIQEQSQMKIYAEQVSQLLATEKNLRLQLTADGEKFQQFQVSSFGYVSIFCRKADRLSFIIIRSFPDKCAPWYHFPKCNIDSQDALVKSNEVFETFKQEIDKMAKSIRELKKENTFLKSKCEKSDVTLIELVEEREKLKKQLEKTKNQKEKLESLCRSLQAERKQNATESNSCEPIVT
ncbi:hypothetical protein Tsubulata_020258, partial [Turnera subulata]